MICVECGGATELRSIKHITVLGDLKVEDGSMSADVCADCGHANLTLDQLAGFELRAASFVFKGNLGDVKGGVLRDTRKALGLRQAQMAELLNRTVETLSRYENDREPIPVEIKLATAGLVDRVIEHGVEALDLHATLPNPVGDLRLAC